MALRGAEETENGECTADSEFSKSLWGIFSAFGTLPFFLLQTTPLLLTRFSRMANSFFFLFWIDQFGAGHRACIGKNISYLEVYKLVPTFFRTYKASYSPPKSIFHRE